MTSMDNPVLLIDDDERLAALYVSQLAMTGVETVHVTDGYSGLEAAEETDPAAILLDIQLPDIDGYEVLRRLQERGSIAPVVVITAHGSVNRAVEAMRLGAYDFLTKPFSAERLQVTVQNALERRRLTKFADTVAQGVEPRQHGFIGDSPAMRAVYRTVAAVAESKASVFITGESGTGKELCAEAIHREGPRHAAKFVALNCAAIPNNLLEAEIFGHKKGAFTGASSDREGAAALACGGTLFLDELTEMDIELQSKLLRFIQTGRYARVGETETRAADIRFIAASNRDPMQAIADGQLREDLYYRLNVVPIRMPPLRERNGDVLTLADALLARFAAEEGKRFRHFAPDVQHLFRTYNWPGNVRQLENVIRNVVVLHDGETVESGMLPVPLCDGGENAGRADGPRNGLHEQRGGPTGIRPLAEVERETIEHAVAAFDGNVPLAAAALRVAPSTLYRKMKAWEEGFG